MHVKISECHRDNLSVLLSFLDEEFVYGKGRNCSLAYRFPNVFSEANFKNIHLVWSDGLLVASVAVKMFQWVSDGRVLKGAMIGFVCTKREFRGHGLGSFVIETVSNRLRESGLDFAVLWTTRPEFYAQLGWFGQDQSIFGEAARCNVLHSVSTVSRHELPDEDVAWLEDLRSRCLPQRVLRRLIDYKTIPLSVDRVQCFSASLSGTGEGYATVGENAELGYVYELVGHPSIFQLIWESIIARYSKLYVNDQINSRSACWLAENGYIVWKPQCQAMWLKLSHEMEDIPIDGWHIPFFDRI